MKVSRHVWLVGLVLATVAPARAQAPESPPPPSLGTTDTGARVHELLPGIGKIGAQVGVLAGASWNPYSAGRGVALGGYIDLPLARAPLGKLSYEIFAGVSLATSDPFLVTNPLAYLANLASGASRAAALAGPPLAPFPVTRAVRTRQRIVQLSPFALKYTITRWDGARLRPYLNLGVDALIVLSREDPQRDESLQFAGGPPFDDPLLAGLIAQAAELTARRQPTGQGNIEVGGHAAAGFELRLSKGLSLNLEYRLTALEGGGSGRLHTANGAIGFHF